MAKLKQIRELIIKIGSEGVDATEKSLSKLEQRLDGIKKSTGFGEQGFESMSASMQTLQKTMLITNKTLNQIERSTRATAEETIRASGAFKRYSGSAGKANKANEGLTRSTKNVSKSFSAVARSAGPIPALYATIWANVYALTTALELLNQAEIQHLAITDSLQFAIGQWGGSVLTASASLRELGLSYVDATKQATKLGAFGFGVDQIAALSKGVKQASVVLGRDFSESLNRATLGIAKQEVELLDELAIVTKLSTAQKEYADSLGLTVNQLNSYQKTQALTVQVIDQLQQKFGQANTQQTVANKIQQQLNDTWSASLLRLGQYNDKMKEFGLTADSIRTLGKGIPLLGAFITASDIDKMNLARNGLTQAQEAVKNAIPFTKEWINALQAVSIASAQVNEAQGTTKEVISGLSKGFSDVAAGTKTLSQAYVELGRENVVVYGNMAVWNDIWEDVQSNTAEATALLKAAKDEHKDFAKQILTGGGLKALNAFKELLEDTGPITLDTAADIKTFTDELGLSLTQVNALTKSLKGLKESQSLGIVQSQIGGAESPDTAGSQSAKYILDLEKAKLSILRQSGKYDKQSLDYRTQEAKVRLADLKYSAALTKEENARYALLLQGQSLTTSITGLQQGSLAAQMQSVDFARDNYTYTLEKLDGDTESLAVKKAYLALLQAEDNVNKSIAATKASQFADIAGTEGLSDTQSDWVDFTAQFDNLKSLQSAMANSQDSFLTVIGQNAEAFSASIDGALGLASSLTAEYTKNKVADIDREINAEKKRDGQSQASLAKIKALEKQKIKEQEKAQIAQVGMSTATAIMKCFSDFGVWGAIPAAGMALLGASQIANIKKSSAGQMADLDTSAATSVTVGDAQKDSSVNVANASSASEYAFVTGQQGSYSPRAGGGMVSPGSSYVVGETGAEVFIPKVPGEIVNAGDASKMGGGGTSIQMNITAMDAASFAEQIDRVSVQIREAVEKELNVSGQSLDRL